MLSTSQLLTSRLGPLAFLVSALACAGATPASPTTSAVPAVAAVTPDEPAAPCPPPARDTLGGRAEYVAYILDGVVLQPYSRQLVQRTRTVSGSHPSTRTRPLDSLPVTLKAEDVVKVDVARGSDAVVRYGVCPGLTVVAITTTRSARRRLGERRPPPT